MSSYNSSNRLYSPSAPSTPDPNRVSYPQPSPVSFSSNAPHVSSLVGSGPIPPPQGYGSYPYQQQQQNYRSIPQPQGYGSFPYQHQQNYSSIQPPHGYGSYPYQQQQSYNSFPPGTHPDVIRSFQFVDKNQNGYIEETELQEALARNYQRFGLRTLRLLIFLFKNHSESFYKIGPKEFAEIWSCLNQWRAIFERFDRDRSGKIDSMELRDALYSLGYALQPSVLQVLISRYDDGTGKNGELNFDSFVECGMIVKGLTEKFKEKDPRYTGSATLTYDSFMSMIIPFLVSD